MSVVPDTNKGVSDWVVKFVMFLAGLAVVGLLSWVITTTNTNTTQIALMTQKIELQQIQNAEQSGRFIKSMENFTLELKNVADNLNKVSMNLYPKEDAVREFNDFNDRLYNLEYSNAFNGFLGRKEFAEGISVPN